MKTIMDAVNEFKGQCCDFEGHGDYIWFFNGKYEDATFNGRVGRISLRTDRWNRVCHKAAFGIFVYELSHASWIKGASLEEYQAADKEVLKVENKTVEVDGMVYEIGKLYGISDKGRNQQARWYGVLEKCDDTDSGYSPCFTLCSLYEISNTGKIAPAPVKLVDGAAYELDYNSGLEGMSNAVMRYRKAGDYFFFDNTIFKREHCTNITRLVPEVK